VRVIASSDEALLAEEHLLLLHIDLQFRPTQPTAPARRGAGVENAPFTLRLGIVYGETRSDTDVERTGLEEYELEESEFEAAPLGSGRDGGGDSGISNLGGPRRIPSMTAGKIWSGKPQKRWWPDVFFRFCGPMNPLSRSSSSLRLASNESRH
jgi:hypothetical protein